MNGKIAIVEDEKAAAETLKSMIERYQAENGDHNFMVDVFSDAFDFLSDFRSDYDVIFMDIEMPGMSGLEAAKRVRQVDKDVIIVFVTNMAQYAIEGYAVQAFDYILKPVNYANFFMKFERICTWLGHRLSGIYITITNRTETIRLSVGDISYIEVVSHDLIYHVGKEEYRTYGTLNDVEKQLGKHNFLRCNSCYLINLKYVSGIRGDIVTVDGVNLKMSRSKRAFVYDEFTKYRGGSV